MNATLMVVFLVTLLMGVPIAFTMVIAGLAAVLVQGSLNPIAAVQNMFAGIDSFPLLAIPFFILAGELDDRRALTRMSLPYEPTSPASSSGTCAPALGTEHTHADLLLRDQRLALADVAGPGPMLIRMMKKAGYPPNTRRR